MTNAAHTALPAATQEAEPAAMSPGMLVLRGLLASGAAVLAGLVVTYLVRVTVNANAFENAGSVSEGYANSGALSAGFCIATLLAVLVLHLLQRVSTRPFTVFSVIMMLGYLAFLGISFTSGLTDSQLGGQLLVGVLMMGVIAVLASWATGVSMDDLIAPRKATQT